VRRREFIAALCGIALTRPQPVGAQLAGKRPVVALLLGDAPLGQITGPDLVFPPARAFVHRLRDLRWIEGRTVVIERRSAEGRPERAPAILAELAARGFDVIMVGATGWLLDAAQRATRTIPIIALFTEDPVALVG
jgi:hypothetical protein